MISTFYRLKATTLVVFTFFFFLLLFLALLFSVKPQEFVSQPLHLSGFTSRKLQVQLVLSHLPYLLDLIAKYRERKSVKPFNRLGCCR